MELKQVVTIDNRFQKSVNLFLDLDNHDKIADYIPTMSSLEVLDQYITAIGEQTYNRATILIGPYGKGKSHLILLLLNLFRKQSIPVIEETLDRMEQMDGTITAHIRQVRKQTKPFLPVLVDGGEESLDRSFARALYQALEREGLASVTPDTYYSKALDKIREWKKDYPDTYSQFEEMLQEQECTMAQFMRRMKKMDSASLQFFMDSYPLLTAGSTFEPMLVAKARDLYQSVNDILCKEHGYGGIYIIFDEFSKYIEGYQGNAFAADMKVLQDLCELADKSGAEEQLHITFVAHKSIREYGRQLSKERIDAFRGVEGRLKEIRFVVSAKNNYELIASAITKKQPDYQEIYKMKSYQQLVEDSYHLPCYEELFRKEDYEKIVGYGCYPLTPAATYLLLRISEMIAQNERTIFTFIAGKQKHSLREFIANESHTMEDYACADLVYDYFDKLLMETEHSALIHNEWLKADYALRKTKTRKARRVIKALALILMIHQREQLPATDEGIRLAAGLSKEDYEEVKKQLLDKEILLYRYSLGTYTFKNNVGVDVEKEIRGLMAHNYKNIDLAAGLHNVSELDFILPKRYNQIFAMTRYFQYTYMGMEQFLALPDPDMLFAKEESDVLGISSHADGKIIAIIREKSEADPEEEMQAILQKVRMLHDKRIVVLYPKKRNDYGTLLRKLTAVKKLLFDEQFIADNVVLEQELNLYVEDLTNEINVLLESDYMVNRKQCRVFHCSDRKTEKLRNQADFNVFLSDLLSDYYGNTPKVNNESINREHISAPIRKARDKVVMRLLARESCEDYDRGTAPEATIYRAVMVKTGIADGQMDEHVEEVFARIQEFVRKASGRKQNFQSLYQILQGEPYGVRRGVIPIFLAKVFSELADLPVIYANGKELSLDSTVLNNINEHPCGYELFVEVATLQKEQYLEGLEYLFPQEDQNALQGSNRLERIVVQMQKWYRSLPQCVRIADYETLDKEKYHLEFGKVEYQMVKLWNRKLQKYELNARDFLFMDIPEVMQQCVDAEVMDISYCVPILTTVKKTMDGLLSGMKQEALSVTKEIFGGKSSDNITNCLKNWYDNQSEQSKSYLHNTQISGFMGYVEHLSSHDEEQIISKLSKIAIDVYVEDWNKESAVQYREAMTMIRCEIEGIKDTGTMTRDDQNSIEFTDSKGHRVKKFFHSQEDSTSFFLKNAMEEAMDEFGDTLEVNQKVSVLVSLLENLLS